MCDTHGKGHTMPNKYVCWDCGRDKTYIEMTDGLRIQDKKENVGRFFCKECYEKREKEREADLAEYIRLKTKLSLERAVRKLERQSIDIYDYKDAIEAVAEFAGERPDKFDSADEIIAAIILAENEIETHIHYKVGDHEVDFYLPGLKAVLEVDGYLHAYKKEEDSRRDKEVRAMLGEEYEIVRVKTKYLEENAELLVEAIKTLRLAKQAKRKKGLLI